MPYKDLQGKINHRHTSFHGHTGSHPTAYIGGLSGITQCWRSGSVVRLLTRRICRASQTPGMATTVQSKALRLGLSTLSCGASSHHTPVTLSSYSTPNARNGFNSSIIGSVFRLGAQHHGSSSSVNLLLCSVSRADAQIRLCKQHLQLPTNIQRLLHFEGFNGYGLNGFFRLQWASLQRLSGINALQRLLGASSPSAPPDTPVVATVLLHSGLSMPTVTLLCHCALNSLCYVPTITHYKGHEGSHWQNQPSPLTSEYLISGLSGMPYKDLQGGINHRHTSFHSHTRIYKEESHVATPPRPHRLSSNCLHRRSVEHHTMLALWTSLPTASLGGSVGHLKLREWQPLFNQRLFVQVCQPLVVALLPIILQSPCPPARHQTLGTTSTARSLALYPGSSTLRLLLHLPFTPSSPGHSQFFCPPGWALNTMAPVLLSTCCYAQSLALTLEYAFAGNTSNSQQLSNAFCTSRASTAMASTASSVSNGQVCNGSLASMPCNGS
eukprot:Gb_28970 [translate_table: standard]